MGDLELKDGYNKTTLGLIPNEWKLKQIGDVIEFQGGAQPPKEKFINEPKEGYIRLIQIRDYKTDNYKTYIPREMARKFCAKDDIMIGRYGPPIFQILCGLEGAYNVALLKAIPSEEVLNKEYARFFLSTEKLFELIDRLSQRTSGQTGVDMEALNNYLIPIPTLKEQEKIVEILLTVDSQIDDTDKLIEKTKALKKGLMQRLLTKGIEHKKFKKSEVGDMPAEWEVKRLGEIVDIKSGSSPSKFDLQNAGRYPFFKVDDMNYALKYLKNAKVYFNNDDVKLMKQGMIIFPKRGASIFTNKISILDSEGYFDTNLMGLECTNKIFNEFLYYKLEFEELSKIADTSSIPQINNKHIEPLLISLPNIKEQKEISRILSLVDNEIEEYENKKVKLEELKNGLMQQLLTGKIRVI